MATLRMRTSIGSVSPPFDKNGLVTVLRGCPPKVARSLILAAEPAFRSRVTLSRSGTASWEWMDRRSATCRQLRSSKQICARWSLRGLLRRAGGILFDQPHPTRAAGRVDFENGLLAETGWDIGCEFRSRRGGRLDRRMAGNDHVPWTQRRGSSAQMSPGCWLQYSPLPVEQHDNEDAAFLWIEAAKRTDLDKAGFSAVSTDSN
jgi:hypothetical protein